MKFLLYGANGYTAQLMIRMYQDFGITPVLAGRSEAQIAALAKANDLEYKVFSLDSQDIITQNIRGFAAVLNCAGPFTRTGKPMIDACISEKIHYLDITGEIQIFEYCAAVSKRAKQAGIMLMPGVGFDVVPTDCASALAKQKMPDATHLKIAFASIGGSYSHGTSITMAEGSGELGARRENGKIVRIPVGKNALTVPFAGHDIFCMSIPWGDVSTAYHSTGIPNIETFTQSTPKLYKMLKYQSFFNWILRTNWYKKRAINKIKLKPAGPSDERRARANMSVWVEASNAKNEKIEVKIVVKEGYTFTALSALTCMKKVLDGNFKIGFQTPSNAYGYKLVEEIEGSVFS